MFEALLKGDDRFLHSLEFKSKMNGKKLFVERSRKNRRLFCSRKQEIGLLAKFHLFWRTFLKVLMIESAYA